MKFLSVLVLATGFSMTMIASTPASTYTLSMPNPSTHIFEVELTFTNLPSTDSSLTVSLPNWRTGRYVILDLANGIVELNAFDGAGNGLHAQKTSKNSWKVHHRGVSVVSLRYKVYANEFSLRARGLNDRRGFVDGTAVFLYSEKYRNLPLTNLPLTLNVVPFSNWHVTTGLDTVEGKPDTFTAPSYDYFADCPLEIGTQKDFTFLVKGKPHVLSFAGEGKYDVDTLIMDISKIATLQADFWGEMPFDRYVFMIALSANGRGGTEHINSTVIGASPFTFSKS